MHSNRKSPRPYGSGTLYQKSGSWYGRWLVGERRMNRRLGPVRSPGGRDGLTRSQAERELRRRMDVEQPAAATGGRLTVEEAGGRLIDHLEALGRKPTTVGIYRSILRTHLAVHLRGKTLDRVEASDVERMIAAMRRRGTQPKTINNALTLLGQVFDHGIRKGWCTANSVRMVDRPTVEQSTEIRFLDQAELEALLRATDDPTDRVLFLVAAMTGLRQGELLALRWMDVDWPAGKIRVRRNYVRGHWTTPKSRRSSRAVPMADRVAGELERHFQRAYYRADNDLVFCHPEKGTVLSHSKLGRRFHAALDSAPASARSGSTTCGTLRDQDGRGWRADADLAGVARAPRLQDRADLCRLQPSAEEARAGRARVRGRGDSIRGQN